MAQLLVPLPARAAFAGAWLPAALSQPLNALSFVTDGILWGARDYRYLRNAMLAATGLGLALLFSLDGSAPGALTQIWVVTAGWIGVRSAFGAGRIWPAPGKSPFAPGRAA